MQLCLLCSASHLLSCPNRLWVLAGFAHDYILSTDAQLEEGLILAGALTDTAFDQTYYPGDYAHVIPGTRHGPYRADSVEGCLVLTFTRGRKDSQLA